MASHPAQESEEDTDSNNESRVQTMYDEVLKMQKISAELDSALETTAVMLGEIMFLENIQFRNCVPATN